MKSVIGWILAGILALVLIVVLGSGLIFFSRGFGGMMGGYGYGMMGRGFGYHSPFGFFGSALFMLIPIGFVILLVLFGAWVVTSLLKQRKPAVAGPAAVVSEVPAPAPAPVVQATCSNCGKPVQADWKNCPYCGNALT
ncbi:MAG TPA: zinc ribbon domain-containing protein [Anaerolineales bacterium]